MIEENELKQIENKIKSELMPFLDGVRTKRASFELFRQEYSVFIPRLLRGMEIFHFIMQDFGETTIQAKEEIHWLFVYLGLVESLGNSIVDMIVILLVANGRDLHIESLRRVPRIRHVTSIKDLEDERVSLGIKLRFLDDNGIKKLASIIDSKLRNTIAHLNFDVKEDEIYIRGKPTKQVIGISLRKLMWALKTATGLIMNLATDKGITSKKKE